MNIMNKYLVIFGGFTPKNSERITEELILFDLEEKIFTYPKITKRLSYIQRKGYIAVFNKYNVIYGGTDVENGNILIWKYPSCL